MHSDYPSLQEIMSRSVLRASLPLQLRHNFQTQWLNSFLFAPQSHSVLGDRTTLEDLVSAQQALPMGIAIVEPNSLEHHFVMPAKEKASRIQWFDHWVRDRRSWWRRHCYDSTMFRAHTAKTSCTILYSENLAIETVTMEEESHVITCSVHPDTAVSCLLKDSTVDEQNHRSLHLHYRVAPFQASVAYTVPTMKKHAEDLLRILKKFDIRLLPHCSEVQQGEEGLHFAACDALGVCFDVLFTESTAQYGYVEMRNRDTSVSEKLDASKCAITLATYLKSIGAVLEDRLSDK